MKRVTIAIASPGDVPQERDAVPKVFTKWNDDNPDLPPLHPKMWENAAPELGGHPQHILNDKIIAASDLLVVIFHSRLGTPTPTAKSGTVEEIREFIAKKGPRRVMVYFCKRAIPVDIDPAELVRLNEFKEEMRGQGLINEYATLQEFEQNLYRHIDVKVNALLRNELPLPPQSHSADSKAPPGNPNLRPLTDFGSSLDAIAGGFSTRMGQFQAIDGCTAEKYWALAQHVYTSAAKCLDRFLTYSAADLDGTDMRTLEKMSTRIKRLAGNLPAVGTPFPDYFEEGAEIAKDLLAHAEHITRCKRH